MGSLPDVIEQVPGYWLLVVDLMLDCERMQFVFDERSDPADEILCLDGTLKAVDGGIQRVQFTLRSRPCQ